MKFKTEILWRSLATIFLALPTLAAEKQLPWQREIPLREAARSVFFKNTLNPTDPLPDWRCYPMGKAMTINNLKMRTTLWGTPDRVTISLMKNNVWDRRINPRGLTAPTLQEIVDGALSPANKDFFVRNHGATGNGTTLDTLDIQKAIDAASSVGGGRVILPAGTYRSGSIRLSDKIELHLM
jgi:hypothetical protein